MRRSWNPARGQAATTARDARPEARRACCRPRRLHLHRLAVWRESAHTTARAGKWCEHISKFHYSAQQLKTSVHK
eukprot:6180437-Pleurochrysis_carterae.AAC.4